MKWKEGKGRERRRGREGKRQGKGEGRTEGDVAVETVGQTTCMNPACTCRIV